VIHAVLAGVWLGGVVFTTAVVSPALKAMKWSEPERILVRSKIGERYAAVVEDRGPGVGLDQALITAALRRNVRTFTGMVLPENARMLDLLGDLKLPERLRGRSRVRRDRSCTREPEPR